MNAKLQNALWSSLPYLTFWSLTLIFSPICDYLINRGHLSVGHARKLFNTIGQWIPMITLIILAYVTDKTWAIILLIIAVGSNAGSNCGLLVNHIDLSPNFAGTLIAITNSVSGIASVISPIVAGIILNRHTEVNITLNYTQSVIN